MANPYLLKPNDQGELTVKGWPLIPKSKSFLHKVIAFLIWPFNRRYMRHYFTAMNGKIYYPSHFRLWKGKEIIELPFDPNKEGHIVRKWSGLLHEIKHLEDEKEHGWWFRFSYLFLPLPIGYAKYRAYWEARAHARSVKKSNRPDVLIEDICDQVCGSDYFWSVPRSTMRQLLRQEAEKLKLD